MPVIKEGYVQQVIERYENDAGMLIPMMQDLQTEYGYLPPEELRLLARELRIPLTRVYGAAMFYASFRLFPRGQHEVTLCMGTVCYLKGAPRISQAICEEYGIKPGGTTTDRMFTLQAVNCVGACALAPVMVVDGKYYDGVTPDSALTILAKIAGAAEDAGASVPVPEGGEPVPQMEAPVASVQTPPQNPSDSAAPNPPGTRAAGPAEAAPAADGPVTKSKTRGGGTQEPAGKEGTSAAHRSSGAAKADAKGTSKPKKMPAKSPAAKKLSARKRSRP